MKVLPYLFILCSLSAANIITPSDLEGLFTKFMQKALTKDESRTLKQTMDILHRPAPLSLASLENSSKSRMSLDCIVCRSAFRALFTSVRSGQTDKQAADTITALCINLGIQKSNVCSGAVESNIPIMAHIIRTTPEASPETFCGLILQRVSDPNFCAFNDPRFEWQVELPEKSRTVPAPALDPKPLKVAIITDAHIDPLYEAFGVADCDEPVCCRKGQSQTKRSKNFLNDIAKDDESFLEKSLINDKGNLKLDLSIASKFLKPKQSRAGQNRRQSPPAGYWGDYRNCDTPIWAYDDAIETIHENHKDVDLIYYVGDTVDHGVWETSFSLINDMNRYLVEKIRKTFGPDVMVIPALGNHESQPTNQFAPASVVGPLNTTWLYESLVDKWGYYLPIEAKKEMLKSGGFSLLARPGLRVISINNNIAYRDNWWLVYDPLDAKRHLDWLVQELHKAELAGEKVHILAHIPPGVADLTHTWTREYYRIVNRFSATIAAEFNGHTHSDEFKIFYSPNNVPTNVAWGGGSVTSYTFYNLNYKIVTLDSQSFVPTRILNYAYNLTEANLTPNRRPHWFLLYDMNNSFRLPDLSAQSMSDLVYSMVTVNRPLLDLYNAFYSKLSDARWPYCNDDCKIDNLCKTVVTVLWERQRCEELRRLFFS
ncbi:hypothetical protein ABMA28_000981 [Loxostege sticticalis]|uniref:Sphingomyelin phosphodiesterase n=1 Tax=Loxostege sticticalis TaxID=481309 RepID=A0ABD0T4K0_LOXSC